MHLFTILFCIVLFLGRGYATNNVLPKQIFEFSNDTFIENIHARDDGLLLLSTFSSGDLMIIDPTAATPMPRSVASLNSTGLTGMATIGANIYAVSGGIHSTFIFANNSMNVYIVYVPSINHPGVLLETINVPNTQMLNGMAALPASPEILLSVDSIGARIFRINTLTRKVDVAFSDPALGPGATVPLGANGLKIYNSYLYFTNSGLGTFGRIKINLDGSKAGNVEIIATLNGTISTTNAYDDFTFDDKGNVYVAVHSYLIMKITPDGVQTPIAGTGGNNTYFKEPTSATLSCDKKSVYFSTGGTTLNGTVYGGQVVQVMI
ncbi:hypothetical protein BPAE_0294g00070 [Botrytis paeoniae]|uniref:SMP-30/Gluconolactonase/LRE-like region domain-containing protein n=1 Tax=Botrytis paeoniae TaxID=278948 RepID=A0A4Z1FG91_9HELO|nr:hypothetical protein BPAE_0294g00070 [Botrytis paeoniae]